MSQAQRLDRKNFLKLTLSIAGASAAGSWLVACGGEDAEGTGGAAGTPGSGGTGAGGKAGASGSAGTSAGTGGASGSTGTAGTGTGGGGTTGAAGKGGGAGTSGTTGGGGSGGSGGGGGTSAGTGGTTGGAAGGNVGGSGGKGGGAFGGAGSGGKGGSGGGSGGSGGKGGGSCMTISFEQNEECSPMDCSLHDHLPDAMPARMEFLAELLAHITGPDALMPFGLPLEGPSNNIHSHDIVFTQQEIDTLLAGGSITKTKEPDMINDFHQWTISCG